MVDPFAIGGLVGLGVIYTIFGNPLEDGYDSRDGVPVHRRESFVVTLAVMAGSLSVVWLVRALTPSSTGYIL